MLTFQVCVCAGLAGWNRPGDYLKPGEDEVEGMKARLDERLGPVESDPNSFGPNGEGRNKKRWRLGDSRLSGSMVETQL